MNFSMRSLSCLAVSLACITCGDDKGDTTDAQTSTATTTNATPATTTDIGGTTVDDPTTAGPSPETTDPTTSTTPPGPTTETTDDPTGETTDDTTTGPPACPYTPVDGAPTVGLQLLASGFDRPVLAVPHPQDPDRLFVVEQGGHVKILEPGETTAPMADFLVVDSQNADSDEIGPEQGLLGFSLHPDFPDDPRVYVNYNPEQGGFGPTFIDEYSLDPNDPNKVDPGSRRLVYAVGQPAGNHNGGMIDFGADGYLYIGMGDGGGGGDTYDTSRDNLSQHAKFLRIDVEADGVPDSNKACDDCPMVDGFDFTVPADNPFVGDPAYAPETWATGLRNPWRWQFDRATGVLYAGDVGQGSFEEVSVIEKGRDYGWNVMEGNHCFEGAPCDTSAAPNGVNSDGQTAPIAEYDSNQGKCSVTGLGVYHSCEVPAWDGVYFYADYCSTDIWALRWDGATVEDMGIVATVGESVIGSGATGHGDILVTTVVTNDFNQITDGKIYRIVPGG
jgi:glucose/arabinose dehydrogenase